MLNLKKTAVAVLAFGSSAVFAGAMGPVCSAVNVTVPCESTAWDFGGKALYLQPSFSNGIGTETTYTTSTASGTYGRNPQWSWGFMIEGSYHFNTGNDININWYHLNRATHRSFAAAGPFDVAVSGLGSLAFSTGASSVSIDPHWDAVNFEFGQHVDFGESKSIRFHGGAQYVRLTNNSYSAGSGTVTGTFLTDTAVDVVYAYNLTGNPTYNGFGPRAGADMAYDWGNGFGVYADAAAALLAGSSKFSDTLALNTSRITASGSTTRVVPELDGKLGATYTYAMAQGDVTIDAGWLWVNYFNVIHADPMNNDRGDFGLQGPYVGLKWLGNVA